MTSMQADRSDSRVKRAQIRRTSREVHRARYRTDLDIGGLVPDAISTGDPATILLASVAVAVHHGSFGRWSEMRRNLHTAATVIDDVDIGSLPEVDQAVAAQYYNVCGIETELMGESKRPVDCYARATEIALGTGDIQAAAIYWSNYALAHSRSGGLVLGIDGISLLTGWDDDAFGQSPLPRLVLARLAVHDGDADGALKQLAACPFNHPGRQERSWHLNVELQAALRLDDRNRLREIVEQQTAEPGASDDLVFFIARSWLRLGDTSRAIEWLDRPNAHWEGRAPFADIHPSIVRAEIELERGRPADAAALLNSVPIGSLSRVARRDLTEVRERVALALSDHETAYRAATEQMNEHRRDRRNGGANEIPLGVLTAVHDALAALSDDVRRQRGDLLRIVAGDIRGALVNIRVALFTLKRLESTADHRTGHSDEWASAVETIDRSYDTIRTIVDGLAELARVATIGADRPGVAEVATTIRGVVAEFESMAQRRQQSIDTHIAETVDRRADVPPRLLETVLGNILSNALSYSPVGSRVSVEVVQRSDFAEADWIGVSVIDQGPGMSADDTALARRRFSRLRPSADEAPTGLGLGLYVADQLVRRVKGSIEIESQPGSGTTVRIWLPAA